MAPAPVLHYTLHAEDGLYGSTHVAAISAFGALGYYRRLRRANWKIVLITDPRGGVTDEAALLRRVTVVGRSND